MSDIKETIEQAIKACNLELYGIERSDRGLIVYIANNDTPISIQDCEKVMKQITYSADRIDNLHIEVSSKGVYPPLFEKEHYEKSVGQWVKIKADSKTYKGELTAVSNSVQLQKGEHTFDIIFSSIQSARLIPTPKGE